ncbi:MULTISPECIES: hemolysin family protein [Azorhizobium]|uniref:Putative HlyC/CorC family transporter n=1 Tax=Azorhizobium caulinodans (strain ATCC 43989 / DSM 5975 / JCM 20966 / LMG 6465 / NBRC 14845 / NCIMB 13405 / ORS 571) TaxID=438753 RepID=A8I4M8_AZOC5|nr:MULTISPECIES: hemolysin family protein [Azorhizobium]TDT94764.1 putative hemolysin [Azorhizobium sp. AG788]BAF87748.1 putative HlyC/CorC family transporter [Azorhizobium caulinodans ORS 571]
MPILEIAIVLFLVLLNALLAAAELSIVSVRPARLKARADAGHRGAKAALLLGAEPGRFLSVVQIGITLIGILAGAFSGASLGAYLAEVFVGAGLPHSAADPLGYAVAVGGITYVSLIIGELIPKRLALQNPERLACVLAPLMLSLSKFAAPAVWVLDASARGVLRLLGEKDSKKEAVTDEEIRAIITEAETAGVIDPAERRMISGVMRLADRPVTAIMTPRPDVEWVDVTADPEEIRQILLETPHSRVPACEGSPEETVGVIQAKKLLNAYLRGETPDPRTFVEAVPFVVETIGALEAMRVLRGASVPMGIVVDEYGDMVGVVTGYDLLAAITGTILEQGDEATIVLDGDEPHVVQRLDGSYLISGEMPIDDLHDVLGVEIQVDGRFNTVAGFALAHLKEMPKVGTVFDALGWRFEIVDMDGRRIDKLLISRPPVLHRQKTLRTA